MGGHLAVRSVQNRVVEVGLVHPGPQVVWHEDLGAAADEGERAHMRANPVLKLLRPRGLGERVAARPEHRHEDLRFPDLARSRVNHPDGRAAVIDEHLLASAVLLPHHKIAPAPPLEIGRAHV